MTQIQIDLTEEENQTVELFKIVNNFETKEDAIKKMIRYFKEKEQ